MISPSFIKFLQLQNHINQDQVSMQLGVKIDCLGINILIFKSPTNKNKKFTPFIPLRFHSTNTEDDSANMLFKYTYGKIGL